MLNQQVQPFAGAASDVIELLRTAPGEARAALQKIEALGADIERLPVFEHLAQVLPAADLFFGGGMLLFTVLVHAAGLRLVTNRFERRLQPLLANPSTWRPDVVMSGAVFQLLALHLIEIVIWSTALVESELVRDWRVAGFFAANTYTTVGYGAFVLPPGWHMLAPIIAMSGLFSIGWTGSVLVDIIRRCQEAKSLAIRTKASRRRPTKPEPDKR
jgi:hypothetical protein